jgi:hypothetical protein
MKNPIYIDSSLFNTDKYSFKRIGSLMNTSYNHNYLSSKGKGFMISDQGIKLSKEIRTSPFHGFNIFTGLPTVEHKDLDRSIIPIWSMKD